VKQTSNSFTSIDYNPDDGLLRLVTTGELVWVEPRFHTRPVLALKHERENDRTLSSHGVSIGDSAHAYFRVKMFIPNPPIYSQVNSLVVAEQFPS
jgi:hypothetical protein